MHLHVVVDELILKVFIECDILHGYFAIITYTNRMPTFLVQFKGRIFNIDLSRMRVCGF